MCKPILFIDVSPLTPEEEKPSPESDFAEKDEEIPQHSSDHQDPFADGHKVIYRL